MEICAILARCRPLCGGLADAGRPTLKTQGFSRRYTEPLQSPSRASQSLCRASQSLTEAHRALQSLKQIRKETERNRNRDRKKHKETGAGTETNRDRSRNRDRSGQRQRQKKTPPDTETGTERGSPSPKQRQKETETQTETTMKIADPRWDLQHVSTRGASKLNEQQAWEIADTRGERQFLVQKKG